MVELDKDRAIEVFGIRFCGVNELKKYACSGLSKGGVYVGMSRERYPCFDSSDYAYEDRYYTYLVFANNREDVERKVRILESAGYCGGCRNITDDVAPVVYWDGDRHHPMQLPECDEVSVPEKKRLKPKIVQVRPDKTKMELLMERLKKCR